MDPEKVIWNFDYLYIYKISIPMDKWPNSVKMKIS